MSRSRFVANLGQGLCFFFFLYREIHFRPAKQKTTTTNGAELAISYRRITTVVLTLTILSLLCIYVGLYRASISF